MDLTEGSYLLQNSLCQSVPDSTRHRRNRRNLWCRIPRQGLLRFSRKETWITGRNDLDFTCFTSASEGMGKAEVYLRAWSTGSAWTWFGTRSWRSWSGVDWRISYHVIVSKRNFHAVLIFRREVEDIFLPIFRQISGFVQRQLSSVRTLGGTVKVPELRVLHLL